MYLHARRVLGLSPEQFWDLTFREYSRECTAAAGRLRDENNRLVTQGWKTISFLGKAFSQQGLPGLHKFLVREPGEAERPWTMAEQRRAFHQFAANTGFKTRPISKAARDAIRRMKADLPRIEAMAREAMEDAQRRMN